jgi:hypothetical protein
VTSQSRRIFSEAEIRYLFWRQISETGATARIGSNARASVTGSPTPEEDADSALEVVIANTCVSETSSLVKDGDSEAAVVVGLGAGPVVAVVAAGTCVSETSPLVFEQEFTAISERHTTATSSFEML